eukprot:3007458-Prymnesium_polylepis.1
MASEASNLPRGLRVCQLLARMCRGSTIFGRSSVPGPCGPRIMNFVSCVPFPTRAYSPVMVVVSWSAR